MREILSISERYLMTLIINLNYLIMAFRKIVKCSDKIGVSIHGFHERKCVSANNGSGANFQVMKDVGVSELCESSLPLVGLDDVIKSGKVIGGNVDFSPNDPTVTNEVQSVLNDYVEIVQSNK